MDEFYEIFNVDGTYYTFPPITIPISETDEYEEYQINVNTKTLAYIAFKYYGNPEFFPIILYANQFSHESDIPNRFVLRIPFPDNTVLGEIREKLLLFKRLYS